MLLTQEQKTRPPSDSEVDKLCELTVRSEDNSKITFKTLVNDPSYPRVITVFVRHFFCGFCEEYIKALSAELSPKTLESLSPPTKLVVIGCGDPALIGDYKRRTSCPYELYADPSRATYDLLDFTVTLANGHKAPGYSEKSFASTVWYSFVNNLTAGSMMLSGGKRAQNGGELVWQDGKLKYICRMKTTTDHMPVAELRKVLDEQSATAPEKDAAVVS